MVLVVSKDVEKRWKILALGRQNAVIFLYFRELKNKPPKSDLEDHGK